jgi:hypothetical protein
MYFVLISKSVSYEAISTDRTEEKSNGRTERETDGRTV